VGFVSINLHESQVKYSLWLPSLFFGGSRDFPKMSGEGADQVLKEVLPKVFPALNRIAFVYLVCSCCSDGMQRACWSKVLTMFVCEFFSVEGAGWACVQ